MSQKEASPSSAGHSITSVNSTNATSTANSSTSDSLYAAIPLKYTSLVRSKTQGYLYESNTGLWRDLKANDTLVLSQIAQNLSGNYKIIDNFAGLDAQLSQLLANEYLAVSESRGNEQLLHLKIDSSSDQTIKEHSRLLQRYQKVDFKTLLVDRGKFRTVFTPTGIAQDFQDSLTQLAHFCEVEILISAKVEYFNLSINQESQPDLLDQNLYIYILGDSDDTTFAETRIRILLDNYLDLFVDSVEVPLSMIPLVGGVSFGDFRAIAKETGVNIYLPSILPELAQNSKRHNLDNIYLSGLEAQVLLAKKFLLGIVEKRKDEVFYKNIDILKFKKDSILLNFKDDISSIMCKYGVFIQLPPLGADESTIHFQGTTSELVERAIVDFTTLTNEIFLTNVWFHKDTSSNGHFDPADLNVNAGELYDLVSRISIVSNVSIYVNKDAASFEFWGSRDDSLKAIKQFNRYANQLYNDFKPEIEFKIELGVSYHEFISGKKNGKISKIMNNFKTSTINFEPLNEYSLLVDLKSIDFNEFLNSYEQLQNEFPSEIRFYIPEAFHRQIIGTGGSLIQSIMRKYNVFIKFSNSYDLKNNFKSPIRFDNVIIRCPSKNSSNIPLVKNELNSLLINNENTTFFNTYFKLSRNQFRLFDFNKIQQIEKKTSTFVRFPNSEPNDYALVEVLGTENHSVNATKLFINELAESYEFKITYSKKFHQIINDTNESYVEKIKVPFKILYNFEIMGIDNKTEESVPYHSIILSFLPESDLFLEDAITYLTSFLRENEFMILDRGELSNNDSIIHGSASRYTQFNQNNYNIKLNAKSHSAGGFYDTNFSKYPLSDVPVQLPQSQQLFQLPNLHERILVSQPTLVQPLGVHTVNQQPQQQLKKRPVTHNGYDNIANKQNFQQRRPF